MPLDIGVGILSSFLVAHLFGFHASILFVFVGILFALLPDIDILPVFSSKYYDHRSFLHYPALYVAVALVVYLLAGPVFAALFSICVFSHFVHDTFGIGWGVAWLWPFSSRKFLFPEALRRREYGWFMSWLPDEESVMVAKYHDRQWVRTYYLRPNPIAYIEYGLLCIVLIMLCFYLV